MSQKANPTIIGGFVLGAVVLGVGGIIIFGGGKFFAEENEFVMFFDGSVKGLKSGADVLFRGVPVGQVSRIVGRYDAQKDEIQIPVYVTLVKGSLETKGQRGGLQELDPKIAIKHLIEDRGLRAKILVDSLLTGRLYVALDFEPESPIRYRGEGEDVPEIPTTVSAMQELVKQLEDLPIEELLNQAVEAIQAIKKLVSMPEIEQIIKKADTFIGNADKLVVDVNAEVDPLSKSLQAALDEARKAIDNIDKFVAEDMGDIIGDADKELAVLSKSVQNAMREAELSLRTLRGVVSEKSEVRVQLVRALEEVSSAVQSIRVLANYLQRHPESLLKGKPGS